MSLMFKLLKSVGLAQNQLESSIISHLRKNSQELTRKESSYRPTRFVSPRTGSEYVALYPDYRALERNKYAPCGRGELSGLTQ